MPLSDAEKAALVNAENDVTAAEADVSSALAALGAKQDALGQLIGALTPDAAGTGGGTPPPPPTVSPDGAVATVGQGYLVDQAGHVFAVHVDGKVYVDGKVLSGTNGVDEIVYVAATDEVRQHNTINPVAPWWSTPISNSGYVQVADPTASAPTGSSGGAVTQPAGSGRALYLGGSWVSDPTRTVDFTKPGAQIPAWMENARYLGHTLDWDWNRQTANSQEDIRQAVVRDGALRLGIAVADATALANVEAGASWKYVVGCASGKPGCFIEDGDVWEIDCYAPPGQWARGRWDGISIYGVDDSGNEVWLFELDVMEIDNAYGGPSLPNVTNPTENWHAGTNSASEYQSGSTPYSPAGDWTKPATYQVVREGGAFQVYCNGVPHGAKRQMTAAQAALHAYAVVGLSVRQGYDSMPTGDGIVISRWETFTRS